MMNVNVQLIIPLKLSHLSSLFFNFFHSLNNLVYIPHDSINIYIKDLYPQNDVEKWYYYLVTEYNSYYNPLHNLILCKVPLDFNKIVTNVIKIILILNKSIGFIHWDLRI